MNNVEEKTKQLKVHLASLSAYLSSPFLLILEIQEISTHTS